MRPAGFSRAAVSESAIDTSDIYQQSDFESEATAESLFYGHVTDSNLFINIGLKIEWIAHVAMHPKYLTF